MTKSTPPHALSTYNVHCQRVSGLPKVFSYQILDYQDLAKYPTYKSMVGNKRSIVSRHVQVFVSTSKTIYSNDLLHTIH